MDISKIERSAAMQRILDVLRRKANMSASDLAEEAFVGVTTLSCGGYLRSLRTTGLLHVSGWRKGPNGFVTPLFSIGNAPDIPRPKFEDADRNSAGMNRIVDTLDRIGILDYRGIASAAGLSANTIKNARYMDILVKQGRVHIAGWRRNKAGSMTPLYGAGNKNNAPKPLPLTPAEKSQRFRQQHRALRGDRSVVSQLLGQ